MAANYATRSSPARSSGATGPARPTSAIGLVKRAAQRYAPRPEEVEYTPPTPGPLSGVGRAPTTRYVACRGMVEVTAPTSTSLEALQRSFQKSREPGR